MIRIAPVLLSAGLVLVLVAPAAAQWDESVDGDLSNDPNAPTSVPLSLGANTVAGTMTSSGDGRDFLTFTVPAGQELVALRQIAYENVPAGTPGNLGYHAINAGATSFIPSFLNPDSFLGGDHISELPSGTDMLSILAGAPLAGTGFSTPLPAGDYCYVIQQTEPILTGYELEFELQQAGGTVAVPALLPAGLLALGLGLLGAGGWALSGRARRS